MKLIRFGPPGYEKPGLILEGGVRIDCSNFGPDWNEAFFEKDGDRRLRSWLAKNATIAPRIDPRARLGPAIARPSKIVCVGLNYLDHVAETKARAPKEPVLFLKATSAMCGPDDDVLMPRGGEKLDAEVELAVVIGKKARYVSADKALEHVFGFALHNDYSERAFQLERGGQFSKGKSADTFAPLGPWVATLDEVTNFQSLALWLKVNNELRQNANTKSMIFDVPALVSYVSQFMTLLPGDVLSTGTPAGTGIGSDPPRYLKPGDFIESGIDKLGVARQRVGTDR